MCTIVVIVSGGMVVVMVPVVMGMRRCRVTGVVIVPGVVMVRAARNLVVQRRMAAEVRAAMGVGGRMGMKMIVGHGPDYRTEADRAVASRPTQPACGAIGKAH